MSMSEYQYYVTYAAAGIGLASEEEYDAHMDAWDPMYHYLQTTLVGAPQRFSFTPNVAWNSYLEGHGLLGWQTVPYQEYFSAVWYAKKGTIALFPYNATMAQFANNCAAEGIDPRLRWHRDQVMLVRITMMDPPPGFMAVVFEVDLTTDARIRVNEFYRHDDLLEVTHYSRDGTWYDPILHHCELRLVIDNNAVHEQHLGHKLLHDTECMDDRISRREMQGPLLWYEEEEHINPFKGIGRAFSLIRKGLPFNPDPNAVLDLQLYIRP